MKKLFAILALLALAPSAANAVQVGAAYQVMRMPSSGTIPGFGAIDLSQSAATTNQLPSSRGGTAQNWSASSGRPKVTAGTWSLATIDLTSEVTGTLPHGSGGTDVTSPGTAGNELVSDGTNWTSADVTTPQTLKNCTIQAAISASTVVIDLKQADGSTAPSATAPCVVGFRSATATSGANQTVLFTAANQITVGATAGLGHTTLTGANIYVYLIQDTTKEICVSNSPYLDDGTVHSATATPANTGGTLYCTNSHTNRPTRLLGVVKATFTAATSWATITKVATVPFRRYDEDQMIASGSWQGSHTYANSETLLLDTEETDNINSFASNTFTVQLPSMCRAVVNAAYGSMDGATDGSVTLAVCGSSRQCYASRTSSNGVASPVISSCEWARSCSVGDTIVGTISGDASYTLDNNGNRTKFSVICTPIPQ